MLFSKSSNAAMAGELPDYGNLLHNFEMNQAECPSCGEMRHFEQEEVLQLRKCEHCGEMFFLPYHLGGYMLYEPCGSGGMGSVYKAVSDKFPEQALAVKVLARSERENPGNIHALLNEAKIASIFTESEFVAGCLDSGFDKNEYFTVMPLVDGERLDQMIERIKIIPEQSMLLITLHILAAEQHIYRMGYLFRDLKPENIIVNKYGYATLLDFGLCIPNEEALNPQNEEFITGSPYYLPPERLLGQPEKPASEIYSLGMVMFYGLTGKTYYEAGELESLVKRHISGLRINSNSKMEGIRKPVADIINKMIQQNIDKRYQTFEEVAQDIFNAME